MSFHMQRRTQNTPRNSQRSIATKKSNKKTSKIDIPNAIKLEEDRIAFQKEVRSIMKEFVKFLGKSAKGLNKLVKSCKGLRKNYQSIKDVEPTIFQLLQDIYSKIEYRISWDNRVIEQLTPLYKSIPKKEESKSLKCQLKQERSHSIRIKGDLGKLEKQEAKCKSQLDHVKNQIDKYPSDKAKREKLKCQKSQRSTQLKNIRREIKEKHQDYNDEIKDYDKTAKGLSKVNQQDQIESLGSTTKVLEKICMILTFPSPSSDPTTTLTDDSLIDDEEQSDSDEE